MLRTLGYLCLTFALGWVGIGCSHKEPSPGLLPTSVMGTVRGNQFARVITHFHSPYSNDACDSKGLSADGTPNQGCLNDIRYALCENHINLTFVTDHVEHLAETDYAKLMLAQAGDTPVIKGGNTVANSIACKDGFGAVTAPGLEGRLLALGMEKHVAGSVDDRKAVYGGEGTTEKTALEDASGPNALVAVPHTESRELDQLKTLQPAAIEIYNLHANLDPKIRKKYLGLKPFEHIAKFMNYLLDPFNELNADYLFMEFLQMSDVYMHTWDALLADAYSSGRVITGIGGLDSHENIFSQKASDGERLDAHRRMTRFMNNMVLTPATDIDSIKASIRAGRVFFVIEGLGTPMGLDFYGYNSLAVPPAAPEVEMGQTLVPGASSSIVLKVPTIHPDFPGMHSDEKASISAKLYFIDPTTGQESIVAQTTGSQIVYPNPVAGYYRAEVWMIPHHLRTFLYTKKYADQSYRWVTTNPIRVH